MNVKNVSIVILLLSHGPCFGAFRSLVTRRSVVSALGASAAAGSLAWYAKNHGQLKSNAHHHGNHNSSKLHEIVSQKDFNALLNQKSDVATKPSALAYMTFNMCNPFEVRNNPELYNKYVWSKRLPRMVRLIEDERPDVIGIQEVRNEKEVYAVAELWKALAGLDYEIVSFKHNSSDEAFVNIIAYNKKRLACDNIQRWWASETPDRFSDSWGDGWGRVSLMATFYPITTQTVRGQNIVSPDYNHPAIHIVNVHRGLKHNEKINSHRVDVEQIAKRIDPTKSIVFIGGDYNTFPSDGGADEMKLLQDAGYTDVLSLKTAEGIPVSGTFVGYSYDKFKSPTGTFGDQLDHIVCQPFVDGYTLPYFSYVNPKKYNGEPEINATCEADFLKDAKTGKEDRDFPSDHLPGVVRLVIIPNSDKSLDLLKKSAQS